MRSNGYWNQWIFAAALSLIGCISSAVGQSSNEAIALPCEDTTAQIQMSVCWSAAAIDADQVLQVELDQTMQQVVQRGSEEATRLLRDSQQKWVEYRDLHCMLEAKRSEGGSISKLEESVCRWRVTQKRSEELRQSRAMWSR